MTATASTAPVSRRNPMSQAHLSLVTGRPPRQMMIVLPADGSVDFDADGNISIPGHRQVRPNSRLWVARTWFWQRRQLLGYHKVRNMVPGLCAGGQRRRINLTAMQAAAAHHAGGGWQTWQQVCAGTGWANTPEEIETRLTSRAGNRLTGVQLGREVSRRFEAQPRIIAMRAHNAAYPSAAQLDPDDIEFFQAGRSAYQNYQAARAICGDQIQLSDDTIEPYGTSMRDRLEYLHQATRLLHNLPGKWRIIAATY